MSLLRSIRRRFRGIKRGFVDFIRYDVGGFFKNLSRLPKHIGRFFAESWQERPRFSDVVSSQKKALRSGQKGLKSEMETTLMDISDGVRNLSPKKFIHFLIALPRLLIKWLLGLFFETLAVIRQIFLWAYHRFRRLNLPLKIVVSLCLIGMLTSAIFIRTLYREAKAIRATFLLEEAETLRDAGELTEAYRKYDAAYRNDPDSRQIIESLKEITQETNSRQALFWGRRLAEEVGYDPELYLDIVELGTEFNDERTTLPYLALLRRTMPNDHRVILADVNQLLRDNRFEAAFARARDGIDDPEASARLHAIYASLGLRLNDVAQRQTIVDHINRNANREDATGLMMLSLQMQLLSQSEDEQLQRLEQMLNHPAIGPEDTLAVAGAILDSGAKQWPDIQARVLEQLPVEDDERLVQLVDWLMRVEHYDAILDLLTEARALEDTVLNHAWLLSRIETGEAEAVLDEMADKGKTAYPELSMGQYRLLRALCYYRMGRVGDYQHLIHLAISSSQGPDWRYFVSDLTRIRDLENTLHFYQFIADSSKQSGWIGKSRLMAYYYSVGDAENLLQVAQNSRLQEFKNDPKAAALSAYVQLLKDVNVPKLRKDLELYYAETSSSPIFRYILAYAYLRSNEAAAAASILDSQMSDTRQRAAFLHLIAAEIAEQNGFERMAILQARLARGRVFLDAEKASLNAILSGELDASQ